MLATRSWVLILLLMCRWATSLLDECEKRNACAQVKVVESCHFAQCHCMGIIDLFCFSNYMGNSCTSSRFHYFSRFLAEVVTTGSLFLHIFLVNIISRAPKLFCGSYFIEILSTVGTWLFCPVNSLLRQKEVGFFPTVFKDSGFADIL